LVGAPFAWEGLSLARVGSLPTLSDVFRGSCTHPVAGLSKAILLSQPVNGAGGPGIRPVIADRRFVQGQLLVLKIYCPEQLADFKAFADKLSYARTIRG